MVLSFVSGSFFECVGGAQQGASPPITVDPLFFGLLLSDVFPVGASLDLLFWHLALELRCQD